ncbi:hypothetical protein BGZ76_010757 [Entomortierella beljakovae]|nr:hypothetical protein BGZ76_010757 [Entomortierella beljakovae]
MNSTASVPEREVIGHELRRRCRWQTFNRYRNIDTSARQKPGISRVPEPPLAISNSNGRNSIESSSKKALNNPSYNKTTSPRKKMPPPKSCVFKAEMTKKEMFRVMNWEHPIVTLDVGAVLANSTRALEDKDLASQVRKFLQDAVNQAAKTKRSGQQLIFQRVYRSRQRKCHAAGVNHKMEHCNTMNSYEALVYSRKAELHPEIKELLERIIEEHHVNYFTTSASDEECVQQAKEFAKIHNIHHQRWFDERREALRDGVHQVQEQRLGWFRSTPCNQRSSWNDCHCWYDGQQIAR